jgi:hypothetical protein
MVEPIQGLPPSPLIDRLASTLGANAVQSFLGFIEQGVPVGQAYAMAFGNDVRHAGDRHLDNLMQAFADLPNEMQQRIAQGADTLPPPVREALDQLGITQTQVQNQAANSEANPATAMREGVGLREGLPSNPALQGLGADARPGISGQVGNAFAAQEAAPRAGAYAQIGPAQQADRAFQDLALPQPGGRAVEGFAAGRVQDPGQAVVMAERMNAAQQQLPSQAMPLAQSRAEALAAQVLPTLAGATILASPQTQPLPGQVNIPVPPGTDAAAAQARDAQLTPAGHTVAGFLRRDLRRGNVQAPGERPPGALLTLLANRRRRCEEEEDGATSFPWLFWILTIVAYGALAVAVVAMIPSGGGLTDDLGQPTYGAYALIVGAIAAVASWFVGRRLSKR